MYSNIKLLETLRSESKKRGRVIKAREMRGNPCGETCMRRFGSWNKALELAGLTITQYRGIPSVVKKLSTGEKMYVAACIDTDGSVNVKASTAYVANNHKGFLENIQKICNGAGHMNTNQGYHRLVFRQSETCDILSQVFTYMIVKKEKAVKILKNNKRR